MIELTVNGEKNLFPEKKTILECLEIIGVKVPTLCYHKALSPYGACRLCMVEVQPKGRSVSLQPSCSYPATDGLSISTDTERLKSMRRILAELFLARCPDSPVIQRLASDLGVKEVRIKKKNDDCIYCGLCVRMCEERMGRSAIGFSGRGLRRKVEPPFGKHNENCWACRACDFICPVGKTISTSSTAKIPIPILDEYNMGLSQRSSIHFLFPQMVPNKPAIDKNTCIKLNYDLCGICQVVCKAEAIDYQMPEEKSIELNTGAIILSPGYELFEAKSKSKYGYSHFRNVITSLEFERILSASGPFAGKVLRPSDKTTPERIAWIQCVGSRDHERNYCSSVCCMYATKEAIITKEHDSAIECDIFFMDLRAFGKGFDEYYQRAEALGIKYIRSLPSNIEENYVTKNPVIHYLTENDKKEFREYDLVVLSTGIQPPEFVKEFARSLGIELNENNFCSTELFNPVNSSRKGVYAAGVFTEPKDIPETVMQASAASAKVLELLSDVKFSLIKPKEYPPETDISGQEPRIGVFVCHCGTNIAGVVNVPEVVEHVKSLPNVVHTENNLYTCSNDAQEKIKAVITEKNLNRVVVASCSPRTHEPLFRNTIREAGLNSYLFEMANIRDQCSWVHQHEPEKATQKAKDLVRMAVAKARLLEPLYTRKISVNKTALVIGGGVSGLTSALGLGRQGFEVHLVEKEKELGGNLRKIHFVLGGNGSDPQKYLNSLIEEINNNNKITVHTGTKVSSVEGFIGNFTTQLVANGKQLTDIPDQPLTTEIKHGVIIVAIGAEESRPTEYFYGQDKRIITQSDFEEKLARSTPADLKQNTKCVVMIQCVGSRDDERPYCSRICCGEAIKNALKIKERNPETSVFIVYRDVRTYGFSEKYYTKAREKGVIFLRYDKDRKPQVNPTNEGIDVTVFDTILQTTLLIKSDLVVLSAAIVPHQENKDIGQLLKVPLNQNNFFLEAHMKLRPIDFATEGIFLAGLAHSPKTISESIAQSYGASARASTILSKDYVELEATISEVIDENCDGCAYCIDPCPYKAITLIEYMKDDAIKKTVEVDETACKGCGTCQATCPKKGIFIRGFKLEQITEQVNAALAL